MDNKLDIGDRKYVLVWSHEASVWRWEPRPWPSADLWLPAQKAPADLIGWKMAPLVDETELWMRDNDPFYKPMASAWNSHTSVPNMRAHSKPGRPPSGTSKINTGHVALFLRLLFARLGLSLEDALQKRGPGPPVKNTRPARETLKVALYALDGCGAPRKHIKTVTSLSSSQTSMYINSASTVFSNVRPWFTQTASKEDDDVSQVMQELRVIRRADVAEIKAEIRAEIREGFAEIKAELPELVKSFADRLRMSGYSDQDIAQAVDDLLASV